MILCGTGHRPDKLGGYGEEATQKLIAFARHILAELCPDTVITGMALGWDTALAEAAHDLNIPFHAYIPFIGQEGRWPRESQARYAALLYHAEKSVYCSPEGYAVWKMQKRNEDMVRDSEIVLALWDGSRGGTSNCVGYANKVGKKVMNVWDEYAGYN